MDLSQLGIGVGDTPPPTQPPQPQGAIVQLPKEFLDRFSVLEELVKKTHSKFDDNLLAQQKSDLLNRFTLFKKNISDFDEKAFFAKMNEKYNEFKSKGISEAEAQMITDKLYQNEEGWSQLWQEVVSVSAPKEADEIIPKTKTSSSTSNTPLSKANLGDVLFNMKDK